MVCLYYMTKVNIISKFMRDSNTGEETWKNFPSSHHQKRSCSPRRASRFLHPPRSPSPSRAAGSGWPGPRLPLQTWVASAQPTSPSAFAFGFQDTRRPAVPSPSGAPLACLRQSRGLHGLQPEPQPPPHPLPRRPSRMRKCARTDRCAQTGHLSCSLIPWVYLCLGVGLLNHTLLPLLVPSGTSIIFSIPALPTPIPTHRGGEFPLLHIFSSTGY